MPQKKRTPDKTKALIKKRAPKKTIRVQESEVQNPMSESLHIPMTPETPVEDQIIQEHTYVSQPVPEKVVVQHHIHLKQAVFLSIGFMVFFTSLLFISTRMKAQEYSASVVATVLPTPLNTRPQKQPTWWDTIDPYTKLYAGTGIAGAIVVGLATLLLLPKKKKPV
jgi:hypothetical protein